MNWADFSKYNFKNKISNYSNTSSTAPSIDGYVYTGIKIDTELCGTKSISVNTETELGEFTPKLNGSIFCEFGISTSGLYGSLKIYENNTLVNTVNLNGNFNYTLQNIKAFNKYKLTLELTSQRVLAYCKLKTYIYEDINTYLTII